jgi:hypothetical protein
MNLALDLYVQAFTALRTERSQAYKDGVKAALARIFEGQRQQSPYTPGSPHFDAFVSGRQEGHQIAASHIATCAAWGDGA